MAKSLVSTLALATLAACAPLGDPADTGTPPVDDSGVEDSTPTPDDSTADDSTPPDDSGECGLWTSAWEYTCPDEGACAWFEGGTRRGADFFSRTSDLGSDWCFPVMSGTEVTVSVGDLLEDTDGSLGCLQDTGWDVYYVIRGVCAD